MITAWYSENASKHYGSFIYRLPDGKEIETTGITEKVDYKWGDAKKIIVCSDMEMLEFVKVNKIADPTFNTPKSTLNIFVKNKGVLF